MTADFRTDLARGRGVENAVATALRTSLGGIALHDGDLRVERPDGPVDIEVKFDERAGKTGNLCLELYDTDGSNAFAITGIAKHATQNGNRLVVHQVGDPALGWLVYQPVVMLRWCVMNPGEQSRTVKPWPNGHGQTWGVLYRWQNHRLPAARLTDLSQLPGTVDLWFFDPTVIGDEVAACSVAWLAPQVASMSWRVKR